MDWRDYVDLEDIEDFLKQEGLFTKVESDLFHKAEGGTSKEAARARVLAKRLEFLAYWIEGKI